MAIDERDLPVFLGMCRRYSRAGATTDMLGLSTYISLPFFPQTLAGFFCVVGVRRDLLTNGEIGRFKFHFTTKDGSTGWMDYGLKWHETKPPEDTEGQVFVTYEGFGPIKGTVEVFAMQMPNLMLIEPGPVTVEVEVDDTRYSRGEMFVDFAPPAPLDAEERRAIASRPNAFQEIHSEIICAKCSKQIDFALPLDPSQPSTNPATRNAIQLMEASDKYQCPCGGTTIDLRYMKQGLHDIFRHGNPNSASGTRNHIPLFEAGVIESIVAEYERLINKSETEEPIQKYLESHPIFWAFLSPARILHKPAVLTKKKADFGILTTQGIFYLIEIEKPNTRLVNRDGSISADIQRGVNQIKDWEVVVGNYRMALLSELGLRPEQVHDIQYILIGGLARSAAIDGLIKMRRSPLATKTQFYCFDELGSFVHSLSGELRRL